MIANYTYSQIIHLGMKHGGRTKKQAVQARQLDRRWKKAYNNIEVLHRKAKCRMERIVMADLRDRYDDMMAKGWK